jgi:hypothetical protein
VFIQSGLEALYHKCHLIFIETDRLNLCHLIGERLFVGRRFEGDEVWLSVVRKRPIDDVVYVPCFLSHHALTHKFSKDFLGRHLGVPGVCMNQVHKVRIKNSK